MQIKVRFFTILRELTGKREETIDFPENSKITVNYVLKYLTNLYGKDFAEYIYDEKTGKIKGFLQFLINGKSASTLQGLDSELQENDVLAIIPPVGGG